MKLGNITKRGKGSWRIKVELPRDPVLGKRRTHYETVKGKRKDAKAKIVEIREKINKGGYVESSTVTVGTYLMSWLKAPDGLSPKTLERYLELAERQIIPHLGNVALQKLTPAHIQTWHSTLLASGRKGGGPLHPVTVGNAHRLLHTVLARAVVGQKVFRNVASGVKPPKVPDKEVDILNTEQIAEVLEKLGDHPFYPLVVVALGTGLRRGELLALQWANVDLETGNLKVEHSVEQTKSGLRLKSPKSKNGRRKVSLPLTVVQTLREHRRQQLETRLALGLGKLPDDALVFCKADGSLLPPDKLSRDWNRLVISRKFPRVTFQALRHSHVSALIDGGLDVFSVSRRIGHGSVALTLKVYTHLFSKKDTEAADAIEAVLGRGAVQ